MQLVISDDHAGLRDAIAATLPGTSWQRCRTHYLPNLLTKVPRTAEAKVVIMVRTIFAQPDPESVWAQHRRVVDHLADLGMDTAADHLNQAGGGILAFTGFPKANWAPDLVQQPPGEVEQRNQAPHQRCGHLPHPSLDRPPRRRPVGRATRRMGHLSLLHEPRQLGPGPHPTPRTRTPTANRGGSHSEPKSAGTESNNRGDAELLSYTTSLDVTRTIGHQRRGIAGVVDPTRNTLGCPRPICLLFPGAWQWGAAIAVLAAVSGVSLWLGWRNAGRGHGNNAMEFWGILLTVAALTPLLIQGVRYVIWAMVLAVIVGTPVSIAVSSGDSRFRLLSRRKA